MSQCRTIRDIKRRKLVDKYEIKRLFLKSLVMNENLSNDVRTKAQLKLSQLPANSSKTRVNSKCVLTNRSKSVYKLFKLSRIMVRQLSHKGLIPGVTKSSW